MRIIDYSCVQIIVQTGEDIRVLKTGKEKGEDRPKKLKLGRERQEIEVRRREIARHFQQIYPTIILH